MSLWFSYIQRALQDRRKQFQSPLFRRKKESECAVKFHKAISYLAIMVSSVCVKTALKILRSKTEKEEYKHAQERGELLRLTTRYSLILKHSLPY